MALSQTAAIVLATALLSLASTRGFADDRCGQLVALNEQYRGVALSQEQKNVKVQLVAWYRKNCGHGPRFARH